MSLQKIFVSLFTFMLVFSATSKEKKVYSYEEISAIIEKVKLGNKKSLVDLMKVSLSDHPISLTEDIVKVVALALIKNKDAAKLKSYRSKIDAGLMSFLDEKQFKADCKKCEGEGDIKVKCKKCVFGKCDNCKGLGVIKYKGLDSKNSKKGAKVEESICGKCHGVGKCLTCKGKSTIEHDCSSCKKGKSFDSSSLRSVMLKSLENISKLSEKKISAQNSKNSLSETSRNEDLKNLYTKTSKKSVKSSIGEEDSSDESGIQKAFKETKAYIKEYEVRNDKNICTDISLKTINEIPTLVLDLNDEFMKDIDSVEREDTAKFTKYWKVKAIVNSYPKEVATLLMHQGKKVNGRFEVKKEYQRVK